VPSLVWSVILLPKKMTEVPMMHTRLTTLHTPCATGVTRDSVLKANCEAAATRAVTKSQSHAWKGAPGCTAGTAGQCS